MTEAIHLRLRQRPRRRVFLFIFAVLAVIFFSSRTALSYYVDSLWFGSLGYAEVFCERPKPAVAVFAAFFAATFLILYGWFLALRRAYQSRLLGGGPIFVGRAAVEDCRSSACLRPIGLRGHARHRLRNWHQHDVGMAHVRALLVCATTPKATWIRFSAGR